MEFAQTRFSERFTKKLFAPKKILVQSLPFLLLSGFGELVAGVVLKNYFDYIELVPGVFVLLPALMNMRGAVESALAARLGTAYHLGLVQRKQFFGEEVKQNFFGAIVLALVLAVASAFFAFFVSQALFGFKTISLPFFLLLAVSASFVGAVVMGLLTISTVFLAARLHVDPDNVTIPLVTTVGDFFMVGIVFVLIVFFAGVIS